MAPSGNSGRMTLLTKKCFRLSVGCTAVHLLSSSFFGLSLFSSLEGIALKFFPVADELTGAGYKDITSILDLDSTLHIEIASRTKAATEIILPILK